VLLATGVNAYFYFKRKRKTKKKNTVKQEEPKTGEEVPREKVPSSLEYEIVRQKDKRTVIVKRNGLFAFKLSPRKEFIDFKKRRFYVNHIIKETQGKKVRYFIRWNFYSSEAYDADGKISYDSHLEDALMNDMESQLGKAVGAAVGFVLERPMMYVMAIAFVVSIPIGFPFNDIFHWVPTTIVHWVPRA